MPTRQALRDLDNSAYFFPGSEPLPAQSANIDGRTFTVQYRVVNRKCFDGMPTPTADYKIDGKRVSRAVFYAAADNVAA